MLLGSFSFWVVSCNQSLALIMQERGQLDAARRQFELGATKGVGLEVAPLLHAWAVMEWKDGNAEKARELFEKATRVDPKCGWLWMW